MENIKNPFPEYDLPLQDFRTGTFSKIVSITTLSFFAWTFCVSQSAFAVNEKVNEQQVRQAQFDAMYERTPEEKLSYRLQKLKDKITREIPEQQQQAQQGAWHKTLKAIGLGGMPVSNGQLADIAAIELSITAAEQGGLKGFDDDEQQIKTNKNLSEPIKQLALQRHHDAKQQVQQRFKQLQQKITQLRLATRSGKQQQAFDDLKQFMEQQQFQKGHTKTDPNHLPFGTPKPETREPLENDVALYQLTHDSVQLAANTVTPEMLSGLFGQRNGTQADLDETIDTIQTQEIKDLAVQLHNNPIEIYTWVANNIRFVPSYGSIQGADMTLQTKRGNGMDTASLLIALLRAANTPARYAYGTIDVPIDRAMNWVGGVTVPAAAANLVGQGGIPNKLITVNGKVEYLRMEHTWVEAWVDFEPSRGMKNIKGDNWIPMDASFKQYEFTQPTVDLKSAVPFDAQGLADTIQQNTTVNETEGWVQGVPQQQIQDAIINYQSQMINYMTTQIPNASIGNLLGLQQDKILPVRPLAAGLPYHLVAKQSNFSEVADSQRLKFKYELWTQSYGEKDQQLFVVEQPTVQLTGKKLALSFKPATQQDADLIASYIPAPDPTTGQIEPALLPKSLPGYLINLVPELTLDNITVTNVNQTLMMGTELISTMGFKFPNKVYEITENMPVAGEYEATALDLQGVPQNQVEKLKAEIDVSQNKLDDLDKLNITKHDILGNMFYGTILSWFAINNAQSDMNSRQAEIVDYRSPSYGHFGTSLQTKYYFGIPKNVVSDGLAMDVDRSFHVLENYKNDSQSFREYMRSIGARESAMEHQVSEMMYSITDHPVYGVSSVKAIVIAQTEGQKVYTITKNNLDLALDDINFPAAIEDEIHYSVMRGMEVTTHQRPIEFFGDLVVGYNIIDPETGSGAYKISGGDNGIKLKKPKEDIDPFDPIFGSVSAVVEVVASLSEALGDVFEHVAKSNPFKAIGSKLAIVSALLATVPAFKNCTGAELFAAVAPLLLLLTLIPIMLGPQGFALSWYFVIPLSFGIGEVVIKNIDIFIEERCKR